MYSIETHAGAAGQPWSDAPTFTFPLASAITAPANIHYISPGGPTPAGCSGTRQNPGAAAGHLCVFGAEQFNASSVIIFDLHENLGSNRASRYGFSVVAYSNAAGHIAVNGTWAVTGQAGLAGASVPSETPSADASVTDSQ